METLPLSQWTGSEHRPLVIGGPCSAESEAQVLESAARLRGVRIDYFRAGIWKARTRPATFEGIGDAALPWLQRAGQQYGMRTATEVATPAHVEAALRHGVSLLWIGARTTVNPFSVQEIADVLDLPENTVKTRMFYARQRLKSLLEAAGVKGAIA